MASTQTRSWDHATTLSLGGLLAVVALGGCIYAMDAPPAATMTPLESPPQIRAAARAADERPDGRWNLRGDGSPRAPFHWAWVPGSAGSATDGGR
jgi:hypothetical protein